MRRVLVLSVAILMLVGTTSVGAASRPTGAATSAMHIVRLLAANRYADAWKSLYPLHQQVAPLDRYVECESLTPIPGTITSIRALRTWKAQAHVAGMTDPIPAAKVKLRIVISDGPLARVVVVKTVAVARVAQRWVWFLPPARYEAYAAGDCPA